MKVKLTPHQVVKLTLSQISLLSQHSQLLSLHSLQILDYWAFFNPTAALYVMMYYYISSGQCFRFFTFTPVYKVFLQSLPLPLLPLGPFLPIDAIEAKREILSSLYSINAIGVKLCQSILIGADWCWIIMIDADWRGLMLIDSDWCW